MTNLPVRSRSPTALNHHDELVRTKSDPVEEEESATEKDNGQEEAESPSPADSMMDAATTVTPKGSYRNPSHRSGRWTLDEKILFLYGLQKFGKGRWKKMSVYLPNRSLVQIKSHAQKVLKRLDVGENVFRRLEDNSQRLETLVIQMHEKMGLESPQLHNVSTAKEQRQQKQQKKQTRPRPKEQDHEDGGAEHIDAASALCQLAAPAGAWGGASDAGSAAPLKPQDQGQDQDQQQQIHRDPPVFDSVAGNWILSENS